MKTLMCLVLDRSGSMAGKESDVIGGVNKFIADQQAIDGEAVISMVRFDDHYENFRPAHDLRLAQHITDADYSPRGGTALLDAIGRSLRELDAAWTAHHPSRAIVVIVTDGQENASREFTKPVIKGMIEAREKSGLWSFIYLGADVNSFADASALGIARHNTSTYDNTAAGTRATYATASASVGTMRMTGSTNAHLGGHISGAKVPDVQPVIYAPLPINNSQWTPPN